MKRLLIAFSFFGITGWVYGAGGANPLTVSSGTYQPVSGYNNADGGLRQAIILGDRASSSTVTVDPLGWIPVQLATSSASGIGSLSAGSSNIGTVNGSQVNANIQTGGGPITVTPGSGTFTTSGASFVQSGGGPVTVTPGSGTFTTSGSAFVQSGGGPVTVTPGSGTFTVGGSGNFIVIQPTDQLLNASCSIKGSSNTVSGSFTAATVLNSTATFGTAQPGIGLAVGFINGSNLQAARVDASSNVAVALQNPAINIVSTNTLTVSGAANVQSGGGPLTVTPGSGTFTTQGALSENGAAASSNRMGVLPAIYQVNSLSGAKTTGRDASLTVGTLDGSLRTVQSVDISRPSFSASTNTWSVASAATDITAICGNAQNTVLVTGLRLSCTQTTAGQVTLSVIKYSTKFTGAWSTMTATPEDSNYTLYNSTVAYFTANPVRGTEVGHVDDAKFGCMAPATATPNDIYISPSYWRIKPIVLRGATQCLAANLEAATVSGGAFSGGWQWTEDSSL